jgi:prepilin-type N-terminal cleavage/methylation domain-containing protein
VRRLAQARSSDERGFTIGEMVVTLAVMSVIVAASLSVLFSVYKNTGVVLNRRDVLGNGQIALQRMTKQFRQTSSIISTSATQFSVNTFTGDGTAHQIAWRTTGSSAPYSLQMQTDGGPFVTFLSYLTTPNIFTYADPDGDGVADQVSISLSLGTTTKTVVLTSDVDMRNL